MRVLAAITDPAVITTVLAHLDLPTDPPALAPARAPPLHEAWPGAFDPVPGDHAVDGDAFIDT